MLFSAEAKRRHLAERGRYSGDELHVRKDIAFDLQTWREFDDLPALRRQLQHATLGDQEDLLTV